MILLAVNTLVDPPAFVPVSFLACVYKLAWVGKVATEAVH